MADWTFTPVYSHIVRVEAPTTLVSRFEDGTEVRRQKHKTFRRVIVERHIGNSVAADAWLDFYRTKGLLTTFTKKTYDPSEAVGTEGTFRIPGSVGSAASGKQSL